MNTERVSMLLRWDNTLALLSTGVLGVSTQAHDKSDHNVPDAIPVRLGPLPPPCGRGGRGEGGRNVFLDSSCKYEAKTKMKGNKKT